MVKRKESIKAKVKRKWIEHIVDDLSGCDPEKIKENIEFAERNIKTNEEGKFDAEHWQDPEIRKKHYDFFQSQSHANTWVKLHKENITTFTRLKKALEKKAQKCGLEI